MFFVPPQKPFMPNGLKKPEYYFTVSARSTQGWWWYVPASFSGNCKANGFGSNYSWKSNNHIYETLIRISPPVRTEHAQGKILRRVFKNKLSIITADQISSALISARRFTQSHTVWRNYGESDTKRFSLGSLPCLQRQDQNQSPSGNGTCAVPTILPKVQKGN